MGTSHRYECEKCEKQVIASLTETDGMSSKVLAVKCNECNEVSDSVTEHQLDWNNEIIKQKPSCQECGSKNVVKWDGKCPECDIPMIDKGIWMLWD